MNAVTTHLTIYMICAESEQSKYNNRCTKFTDKKNLNVIINKCRKIDNHRRRKN